MKKKLGEKKLKNPTENLEKENKPNFDNKVVNNLKTEVEIKKTQIVELSDSLKHHVKKSYELENDIKNKEEVNFLLIKKVKSSQEEFEKIKKELENAINENEEFLKITEQEKIERKNVEIENGEFKKENSDLRKKIEEAEITNKQLEEQKILNENLLNQVRILEELKEELTEKYKYDIQKEKENEKRISKELESSHSLLSKLKNENQSNEEKIDELKRESEELRLKISSINETLQEKSTKLEETIVSNESLMLQFNTLNENFQKSKCSIDEKELIVEKLEETLLELKNNFSTEQKKVEILEEKCKLQNINKETMENLNLEKEQKINELKNRIEELNERILELKKELKTRNEKLNEESSEKEHYRCELNKAVDTTSKQEKEIQENKKNVEEIKTRFSLLEKKYDELNEFNETETKKLIEINNELDGFIKQILLINEKNSLMVEGNLETQSKFISITNKVSSHTSFAIELAKKFQRLTETVSENRKMMEAQKKLVNFMKITNEDLTEKNQASSIKLCKMKSEIQEVERKYSNAIDKMNQTTKNINFLQQDIDNYKIRRQKLDRFFIGSIVFALIGSFVYIFR